MPSKRKKTFVLVLPSFEDIVSSYYAGKIINGVALAASRLQVDILLHITDRFDHRGWLDSSLLDRDFIEGIIFGEIDNDLNPVKKAIKAGMPTIVLNNSLNEPINWVAIDNYRATREVVDHLIDLGHRRIATIAGDPMTQAGLMRNDAFQDALKAAGIEIPKTYLTRGDFMRTPARQAAQKLLRLKERPTAVFAASDVMAMEMIDVAREHGIKVPQELSVVGFDDNSLNMTSPVRLTTVYQPLIEMGRLGLEHLYLISRGKAVLPMKTLLPAKLVVRQSTAACTKEQPVT